jgi:hypothetical protein
MERMHVLVANEPCAYREAIADVLRTLRPDVEVNIIEPNGLNGEVARLRPHLVVCSQPCDVAQNGAFTWVVLYPNGDNWAEVITLGERTTVAGITFGDLLSIIDSTELLCRSA